MPDPDEVREELTAYLDGELDPAARGQVEERLKHDAHLRGELQHYERAWDLLDNLDRSTVGDSFTKTTLEMVAVAAEEDVRRARIPLPPRQVLLAVGLLGLALGLGFAVGRGLWPDTNQQLLGDLPVLENIDVYDQGESIDFLRKLQKSGLFDEEPEHGN